jgi:2-polyprenyl-3-methyl-5-hydroxy-6-metoxy-1,4-benzoquinol methylase
MILPKEELCNQDPLLKSFRDADLNGFLHPQKTSNRYFLTHQRVRSAVEALIRRLPKAGDPSTLVADIACGPGNAGLLLSEAGFNVEFVDNETRFFDYIKMKSHREDKDFLASDVNSLDVNQKYDGIIFGEAIEHMAEPSRTLEVLHKSLKRGGHLVLTTPNGDFVDCSEPCWNDVKNDKERNRKLANNIGNHVCEFKPSELKSLVKEAGFVVLEHFLVNSKTVSRRSLLRRLLPFSSLRKLDQKWSKRKVGHGKDLGRIQIIVAQRAH